MKQTRAKDSSRPTPRVEVCTFSWLAWWTQQLDHYKHSHTVNPMYVKCGTLFIASYGTEWVWLICGYIAFILFWMCSSGQVMLHMCQVAYILLHSLCCEYLAEECVHTNIYLCPRSSDRRIQNRHRVQERPVKTKLVFKLWTCRIG